MQICVMEPYFAIVGCGRIAEKHAEEIKLLGNLIAVCDNNPTTADLFAQKYNAHSYYDLSEMLEKEKEINIVSVCSPNYLHPEHTIKSLNAGKHVLCEKPLAIDLKSGEQMLEAAITNNKKLFVVKSCRHNPLIQHLKRSIDDNKIGKILSFQLNCVWNRPDSYFVNTWKGSTGFDGGILYTQFSHYIDVLLWFLNDEAEDFKGFRMNTSNKPIDFEDTGAISIKMRKGTLGSLHYSINAVNKNQEISLTIVAEKGTIKLGGIYMNELLYQCPEIISHSFLDTEMKNPPISSGNHQKVYDNLLKALNGEEPNLSDGISAMKTVAFISKLYQQIPL